MANGGVPDRWRDYKPVGTVIEKERIISFKTPLSTQYNSKIEDDNGIKVYERFTPSDLINMVTEIKQGKYYLGMVIDLTNTKRYYNAREFISQGVEYRKMNCVGHEIPSEDIVRRFEDEVVRFMEKAEHNSILGVHCTHGLNRAGYLVCRYLIDCRGYDPEEAIKAFNKARGYNMERDNYLEDLRKRVPNQYVVRQNKDDSFNSYNSSYHQVRQTKSGFNSYRNRYHQVRQTEDDSFNSYSHSYHQPWPDQRWYRPAQQDSFDSSYGSGGFRNEYQFQRKGFLHRTTNYPWQSESYNSYNRNHSHYQYNQYEGQHGRQILRPPSFYRQHKKKPYSFKNQSQLY